MNGPYGFKMEKNCESCSLRSSGYFCDLAPKALKDLSDIRAGSTYLAGAVLFVEKQDPRGVFLLCEGEAKLSISSSSGKTLILRIAKPGEVLGLMPVLAGTPYEVTAETLHPCQITYLNREDFLRLVAKHPEIMERSLAHVSTLYNGACEQLRTVGLSSSATEKMARLLVEWSSKGKITADGTQLTVPLTHEEIAEFIGSTRETVTRTLGDFKTKKLVSIHGSTMTIRNLAALESMVTA
jgi:CRP/FNR family transcriptional regulator